MVHCVDSIRINMRHAVGRVAIAIEEFAAGNPRRESFGHTPDEILEALCLPDIRATSDHRRSTHRKRPPPWPRILQLRSAMIR